MYVCSKYWSLSLLKIVPTCHGLGIARCTSHLSVMPDPEQPNFELCGFTYSQILFNSNYCGATELWLVESVVAEEPRIPRADKVRLGLTPALLTVMAKCSGLLHWVLAPIPGATQGVFLPVQLFPTERLQSEPKAWWKPLGTEAADVFRLLDIWGFRPESVVTVARSL